MRDAAAKLLKSHRLLHAGYPRVARPRETRVREVSASTAQQTKLGIAILDVGCPGVASPREGRVRDAAAKLLKSHRRDRMAEPPTECTRLVAVQHAAGAMPHRTQASGTLSVMREPSAPAACEALEEQRLRRPH